MKIGYARVSTGQQDTALQTDALEKAGCEKIFQETASGAQRDRPQLKEALAYLREGDILVVWKLDRLARSLRQLIETVEDLSERGVGFISITENVDTTNSGGKLVFHLFGALAEFERDMIRERTKAGLAVAKANGRVSGRPRGMSDTDVKAAKALQNEGSLSSAEIAAKFGISRPTLYRYLKAS